MIHIQRFFLSIFLLVFAGTCLAVPAGVNWQWANPTPQGNSFNDAAFSTNLDTVFVVGDLGSIAASNDFGVTTWAMQVPVTTQNLNSVTYDNVLMDTIYAVGDQGTILTSGGLVSLAGLANWTAITSGTSNDLNSVVFNQNASSPLFVAVGDNGTVLTNNGVTPYDWPAQLVPVASGNLMAVEWNGVRFVAVSDTGKILRSDNGLSWTNTATLAAGLNDVIWTGSRFVAVGDKGLIVTSTDGIFWIERNPATGSSFENLRSVALLGSQLVAVGRLGIYISTDGGVAWTLQPGAASRELNGIVGLSGQSLYLAVTRGGQILVASDGVNWTRRLPSSSVTANLGGERIEDVVWNGSQFLAVGGLFDGSSNTITLASVDGINWTANVSTTGAPSSSVSWDGGQFIGVSGTTVYSSSDGTVWSASVVASSINLNDVVFDGTQYIAVGINGVIYTSANQVSWTPRSSGTANTLYTIATNGSITVVAGDNATILISTNAGANWQVPTLPSLSSVGIFDVVWSGSQFVAVGDNGTVLTSSDGNNWVSRVSGISGRLRGISWNGSQFTAVSGMGEIITSPDAVTWTSQTSNTTNVLTAVAGTEATQVAVGWDGAILTGIASYTIGGSITGLNGTLVLQNNGGDDLTVSATGSFNFATPLVQGATYDVSILSSPSAQTCNLVSGKGAVNTANVTSVAIDCSDNSSATNPAAPASSGGGGGAFNFYLLLMLSGVLVKFRRQKNKFLTSVSRQLSLYGKVNMPATMKTLCLRLTKD